MFNGNIRRWNERWDDAESLYTEALSRAKVVLGHDNEVIAKISKCLEKDPESCKSAEWTFYDLPSGHGKFLGQVSDIPFQHRLF